MSATLSFLLFGFGTGAVYAAIGMSIVLVNRASGVVNIAQGSIAMIAALVFVTLRDTGVLVLPLVIVPAEIDVGKVPTPVAIIAALAVGVLVGLVAQLLVFNPMRDAPPVTKLVASIGLTIVLQGIAILRFGLGFRRTKPLLPDELVTLFGRTLPRDRLWLAFAVLLAGVGLWAMGRYTRFGLATRAAAESEKGALLIGLSPSRLATANWVLASAVTSLAGILVTPIAGVNPFSYSYFVIPALAAALAGRLRFIGITCAVGLMLGSFQAMAVRITSEEQVPQFLRGGFDTVVPLVVIIIALAVTGTSLPRRGQLTETRQPRSPAPAVRIVPVALAFAGAAGILIFGDSGIRLALIQSLVMAALVLSVVVLTGFVGQVSLGQMAFAGLGAYLCAHFADERGIPFPLSPLLAIAVTTSVGVIVGLPAVRIRGVQLAVVTLAFAVAAEQLLFRNGILLGNDGMANVPAPIVFGIDFGILGLEYPQRPFGLLVLAVVGGLFLLVANLRRGTLGRRLLAVRANERAAAASGIDVVRAKLQANALAALVAAVAGVIYAYVYTSFNSAGFEATQGLQVLSLAYLGGVGSLAGALVAGALAPSGFVFGLIGDGQAVRDAQYLVSGLGLVIVAARFPDGLAGVGARLLSRLPRFRREPDPGPDGAEIEVFEFRVEDRPGR